MSVGGNSIGVKKHTRMLRQIEKQEEIHGTAVALKYEA